MVLISSSLAEKLQETNNMQLKKKSCRGSSSFL